MAVGRTKQKYWRVYANGYDLSGYSRSIGPLALEYDEADLTAYMSDVVKGYLPNMCHISPGTLNAVFDNTATTGLYALTQATAGSSRNLMVPIGIRAAPADGDPVFCGQFYQDSFNVTEDGGAVTATIQYSGLAADATTKVYAQQPWGILLHAKAIRTEATGVNTAAGFLNYSASATTTQGGYFMYQVFAGDGTLTLSVQDSDDWDDPADYDITVATTGLINCAVPTSGVIAVPTTTTLREGLRWQIDFNAGGGTATTVTFACAFMRIYDQT